VVAGEITPNEAAEIAKLIGDCVKACQTAWVGLAKFPAAAGRCDGSGGMIAKLFSKKKLDLGSMDLGPT